MLYQRYQADVLPLEGMAGVKQRQNTATITFQQSIIMNHRRDYKKSSLFIGERGARIAFQRTIVSVKDEPGRPGKMSVITVHAPWESIVVKE